MDDGSKDGTVAEVKKLHEKDERVRLLSFTRNFGKEAAMYAGMQQAKGNYVAIMDVDLQDPPEKLSEMYSTLKKEDLQSDLLLQQLPIKKLLKTEVTL